MPVEKAARLLLGLEVVQDDGPLRRLLTPVLDHAAGAVDDLARVALPVQNTYTRWLFSITTLSRIDKKNPEGMTRISGVALTETSPLAQLLAILDLDQGDLVLGAESDDELLIGLLLAVLVQDAHVSLTPVEGLGSLAETPGEAVVYQSQLQNALQGILHGHLTLGGIGRDLDLLGGIGSVVLFYVRLYTGEKKKAVSHLFQVACTNASCRIAAVRVAAKVVGRHGWEKSE